MRERIKALKEDDAKAFCTRLWFELTIAGRAIWSDESLDQATQLNALKWLNEIQHRVWGAYSSNERNALESMLDQVIAHCDKAQVLQLHVRLALDRSLAGRAHWERQLGLRNKLRVGSGKKMLILALVAGIASLGYGCGRAV